MKKIFKIFFVFVLIFTFTGIHISNKIDTSYASESYIDVGITPINSIVSGNNLYVLNYGEDTVSVINTNSNLLTDTITVGYGPIHANLIGNNLYIVNQQSDSISVIDTSTNTVVGTIAVGSSPGFSVESGGFLYVLELGSTISVIDLSDNTVTETIELDYEFGYYEAFYGVKSGSDIYIFSQYYNVVLVLDTNTNTITTGLVFDNFISYHPFFTQIIGDEIFITTDGGTEIEIIDTLTQSISGSISMPDTSMFIFQDGNNLYVTGGSEDLYVIDSSTKTITDTINISNYSSQDYILFNGDFIYIIGAGSDSVTILNKSNNQIVSTLNLAASSTPSYGSFSENGETLYIINQGSDSAVILNTSTNSFADFDAPEFESAEITENTITITYNENLDDSSVPSFEDFTAYINGEPTEITNISIVNEKILIEILLIGEIYYEDEVLISYEAPEESGIQDVSSNKSLSFQDEAVLNNNQRCRGEINIGTGAINIIEYNNLIYIVAPLSILILDPETNLIIDTISIDGDYLDSILFNNKIYLSSNNTGQILSVNLDTKETNLILNIPGQNANYYDISLPLIYENFIYFTFDYRGLIVVLDTTDDSVEEIIDVGALITSTAELNGLIYVSKILTSEIVVIDTQSNTIVQVFDENNGIITEPIGQLIAVDNKIYIAGEQLMILDTDTNQISTALTFPGISGSANHTTLKYENYIYVFNDQNLYVIDTNTNTLTASFDFDEISSSVIPIIVGDIMYVVNHNEITKIDLNTNEIVLEVNYGGDTNFASYASMVYENFLYFGASSILEQLGMVFVLDLENDQIYNCRGYGSGDPDEENGGETTPTATSNSTGGTLLGCKDESATNYNSFASHRQNLCQYGEVEPYTQKQEIGNSCPVINGYHFFGQTHPEIRLIQSFLLSRGFYQGEVTGVFDKKTDDAVKSFQNKYAAEVLKPWGLKRATGWWYKTTNKKANELLGCQVREIEIKID